MPNLDNLYGEAFDLPPAAAAYLYGALVRAACDGARVTPATLRGLMANALAVA